MIDLTFIKPQEIVETDLQLFRDMVKGTGHSLEILVKNIVKGYFGVLRVSGDVEGLVVYEHKIWPEGAELHMWGVAGSGLVKNFKEFVHAFEDFAGTKECNWVSCSTWRKGFSKLYKKHLGIEPVTYVYRKELDNA